MSQFDTNHDGEVTFIEYMEGVCGQHWKVKQRDEKKDLKAVRESIIKGIVIRMYTHKRYNVDDPIHGKDLLEHFESFDLRDGELHHSMKVSEFGDCISCAGISLTESEVPPPATGPRKTCNHCSQPPTQNPLFTFFRSCNLSPRATYCRC